MVCQLLSGYRMSMKHSVLAVCVALTALVQSVLAAPPTDATIPSLIDRQIGQQLEAAGIPPAELASDLTLLRRTTLDLVGRIPTVSEARAYLAADHQEKRITLVDRLIASAGFTRHQADTFDAFLMHGTSTSLTDYLRTAFTQRRPWDEMFRDMLAVDDGSRSPAEEYVKARVKDLDRLTNDASVMFFGVNVSCAKCHDHPLVAEWSQAHFYGMKSFFYRSFEHGDFVGERSYGNVKYKTTAGEELLAPMMFLTGTAIAEPETAEPTAEEKKAEKKQLDELKKNKQPPPTPTFSRRVQLAEVALRAGENHYFARAITNRVWYQLVGHALVMPLDQMHPENAASHPKLLNLLAQDLIDHDYDLQYLIRGIVLSDTYARTSRWEQTARPAPKSFAVANVRPLGPFQYANSLHIATIAPDYFAPELPGGESDGEIAQRVDAVMKASRPMAGLFVQPQEDFQVGVTEALLLNNSQRLTDELLRDTAGSLVGQLVSLTDNQQLIEMAFWNVLVRPPDKEESKLFDAYLKQRTDRQAACQQLVWSLLASSELRFNY